MRNRSFAFIAFTSGSVIAVFSALILALTAVDVPSASAAGSAYTPISPVRLVSDSAVGAGGTIPVQVTGVAGVPSSGVAAVNLTITATDASTSFVTAYPYGGTLPATVNLSLNPNQTMSNAAVVQPASNGYISIYNNAGVAYVYVDIYGYYSSAAGTPYVPLTPSVRLVGPFSIGSGQSAPIQIDGQDGIPPSGVTTVTATLSAANVTGNGYLVCYSDGSSTPPTSSENLTPGVITSVLVQCPVSTSDGKIRIYNGAASSVTIYLDVQGYYGSSVGDGSGAAYQPITPIRVASGLTLTSGQVDNVTVEGSGGVPTNATAIVADVTIVSCAQSGYVEEWPTGGDKPDPATVILSAQPGAGLNTTDLVTIVPGKNEEASFLFSSTAAATCRLYVDLDGYFGGGSAGVSYPCYSPNHCWGVDSAATQTATTLSEITSGAGRAPDFFGRYLTSGGGPSALSSSEISVFASDRIPLLLIADKTGSCSSTATGSSEASAAISAAGTFGVPANGAISLALDIEASNIPTVGCLETYANAIVNAGYRTGFYLNPNDAGMNFCSAAGTDSNVANALVWSSIPEPGVTGPSGSPTYGPTPLPCNSGVEGAWQYGEGGTIGGVSVDADEMQPASQSALWLP